MRIRFYSTSVRGGNKEGAVTQEHARRGLTHGEPDAWTGEVSFLGSVDPPLLATLPRKMP